MIVQGTSDDDTGDDHEPPADQEGQNARDEGPGGRYVPIFCPQSVDRNSHVDMDVSLCEKHRC